MAKVLVETCSRCGASFDPKSKDWLENQYHEWLHACPDGVTGGVGEYASDSIPVLKVEEPEPILNPLSEPAKEPERTRNVNITALYSKIEGAVLRAVKGLVSTGEKPYEIHLYASVGMYQAFRKVFQGGYQIEWMADQRAGTRHRPSISADTQVSDEHLVVRGRAGQCRVRLDEQTQKELQSLIAPDTKQAWKSWTNMRSIPDESTAPAEELVGRIRTRFMELSAELAGEADRAVSRQDMEFVEAGTPSIIEALGGTIRWTSWKGVPLEYSGDLSK